MMEDREGWQSIGMARKEKEKRRKEIK